MSRKANYNNEQESVEIEPERLLVHKLVDSSKAQRTKAIERLKSWINARTLNSASFFTYDDLIKIWKGLYYNMWMADKPILQEQLATEISSWIHEFRDNDQACLYIDAGFATFAREWWGIDRWRLSKFMTFVRYFLRESFMFLKNLKWLKADVLKFTKMLRQNVLSANGNRSCDGLKLHVTDIYLEELAQVAGVVLKPKRLILLLSPFFNILKTSDNEVLVKHVYKNLFIQIIQFSDVGIDPEAEEEMEAIQAFGRQAIEEEMETNNENDEQEEIALQFDYKLLSAKLVKVAKVENCKQRNRKQIYELARKFDALSRGIYPLSDERLPEVFESNRLSCEVDVNTLREFQKDLGELGHKKKSKTKPEEIDQLLEKYDIKKRRKKHRGKGGSKKKQQQKNGDDQ
ncbi:unnamed protein product [Rotaria magnacalcarata]|uniref:Uncharacterized protein n=1 Tax=Rotaria magnacalcarata TaxID=392030 RepID=A0A815QAK4_9BILA|nr:unnamed protein product [Rotaria magnacalcarata]CAF1460485.1 unnamed protein product [Rotaria magnacalcarata]CAF1922925.1 unnamed protein product [Rotaria magnacalcarata]CAF3875711.1 unnamed protein product [Rotaria magnacalcarata]CAF3933779.1 unnamed protein product [Rotaria magnacalcarata]